MLGERNVVYVVFIIELESLENLGNLEILKILNFLNLLTYILIVINKATIRITDSFSFDYANIPYCMIVCYLTYTDSPWTFFSMSLALLLRVRGRSISPFICHLICCALRVGNCDALATTPVLGAPHEYVLCDFLCFLRGCIF